MSQALVKTVSTYTKYGKQKTTVMPLFMVWVFFFNSVMISQEKKEMAILKLDVMEKTKYRKKLWVIKKKVRNFFFLILSFRTSY